MYVFIIYIANTIDVMVNTTADIHDGAYDDDDDDDDSLTHDDTI